MVLLTFLWRSRFLAISLGQEARGLAPSGADSKGHPSRIRPLAEMRKEDEEFSHAATLPARHALARLGIARNFSLKL